MLIVGITENDARPDEIVGVCSPQSELKTRIASSIAGNISPTPPFDIGECALPTDAAQKLCVIRVRSGNALHLLTKKGEQPVCVRNEDESRPAAAQLRSLIDRRYDANRTESEVPSHIGDCAG